MPCPWDTTATAAAAAKDIGRLQWLRAQDPPCPWSPATCAAAAGAGRLDILKWLRGQNPPCPWTESCAAAAACQPNLEVLQWLHGHGCPWGEETTFAASRHGNLPTLQWLHFQGCPLHPHCLFGAECLNRDKDTSMPMLEWLCEHGSILPGELYACAARARQSRMLRLLHSKGVPLPHNFGDQLGYSCNLWMPNLMFLADNGANLSEKQKHLVAAARKAHCTFHGLVRWCRRAVSDPSRGAHRAFDSMATDTSGQVLLSRLSMLPSDLLHKIAVAAELQHDIFSI